MNHRKPAMGKEEETERLVAGEVRQCNMYCDIWSNSLQIFPPFLLAGLGTVGAGLLLNHVQGWEVFQDITELFVLVPALLGLKGNLAMTLASRLSTESHRGITEIRPVVMGYLALDQAQALIVGILAALIACVSGAGREDPASRMLLVGATAVVTASLVSFTLGSLMCAIVLIVKHYHFNPDNIATPIAASIGDIVTLTMLSVAANALYNIQDAELRNGICTIVIMIYLAVIPPLLLYSWNNFYARPAVLQGWAPILLSMLISSGVGIIMSKVAVKYPSVLTFLPIINGVGGNLAAVQASRLSTSFNLHNKIDADEVKMSLILVTMLVPGHTIFLLIEYSITNLHMELPFYAVYLLCALIQVSMLLTLAYLLVLMSPHVNDMDPDLYSIPILTAMGDFLGTSLLSISVIALDEIGWYTEHVAT